MKSVVPSAPELHTMLRKQVVAPGRSYDLMFPQFVVETFSLEGGV